MLIAAVMSIYKDESQLHVCITNIFVLSSQSCTLNCLQDIFSHFQSYLKCSTHESEERMVILWSILLLTICVCGCSRHPQSYAYYKQYSFFGAKGFLMSFSSNCLFSFAPPTFLPQIQSSFIWIIIIHFIQEHAICLYLSLYFV